MDSMPTIMGMQMEMEMGMAGSETIRIRIKTRIRTRVKIKVTIHGSTAIMLLEIAADLDHLVLKTTAITIVPGSVEGIMLIMVTMAAMQIQGIMDRINLDLHLEHSQEEPNQLSDPILRHHLVVDNRDRTQTVYLEVHPALLHHKIPHQG